jgi:hypothetical protein
MNSDRPKLSADEPDADRALQQALAALPPQVDPARMEALNRRVMTQWQEARGAAAEPVAAHGMRGWLALHGGWRSRWLAGATGLALGLALLAGTWLRSSDPALDELMQPDVLSQMAAGEM